MKKTNQPTDVESEDACRDQSFDPFYEFTPTEAETVANHFFPLCEAARPPRGRARRQTDLANYKLVLATVIANAFRASENRPSRLVYYSRKTETFSSGGPYLPSFLRHTNLLNALDALAEAGYLESNITPSRNSSLPIRDAKQSTFQATDRLLQELGELGIASKNTDRNRSAPLVILKGKGKKLEQYDPNDPPIKTLISTVRPYNAFLDRISLRLDVTESELSAMYEAMAGDTKPRSPINFNDTRLRRIFNNGTFKDGGRFYGGWWQIIPSRYRSRILIDGERTIELDYSGCLPRMLYHRAGIDYQEDIYELPELKAAAQKQGMNWESVRDSVKVLLNVLINARREQRIGKISDLSMPRGFKQPNKVYPLIEKKHAAIAGSFRSGAGLQLQRLESDICEAILTDGVARSIAVLPIHDSFVVQVRHRDWLCTTMTTCYRDLLGYDPIIKEKKGEGWEREDKKREIIAVEEPSLGTSFRGESVTGFAMDGYLRHDSEHPNGRLSKGSELWASVLKTKTRPAQVG